MNWRTHPFTDADLAHKFIIVQHNQTRHTQMKNNDNMSTSTSSTTTAEEGSRPKEDNFPKLISALGIVNKTAVGQGTDTSGKPPLADKAKLDRQLTPESKKKNWRQMFHPKALTTSNKTLPQQCFRSIYRRSIAASNYLTTWAPAHHGSHLIKLPSNKRMIYLSYNMWRLRKLSTLLS
eukprot:15365310-Ditylum_brightwellii.AAC.1